MKRLMGCLLWLPLALLGSLAYNLADGAVDQLLGSEEVWVYGECYDYFDNVLSCAPDSESPGSGVTDRPGQLVVSSGCYTECDPLDEPYSYRVAPLHADTVAGFAAFVATVLVIPYGWGRLTGQTS